MDFDFTSDQELFFASAKEYAEKYFLNLLSSTTK